MTPKKLICIPIINTILSPLSLGIDIYRHTLHNSAFLITSIIWGWAWWVAIKSWYMAHQLNNHFINRD